jgi:prophage DNA circulation protein
MSNLSDLDSPWRKKLLPASFKGVEFHVEAAIEERGRRLVVHEFPKKNRPYAEDMGRRAFAYTVRGYVIAYGRDRKNDEGVVLDPRYVRDYTLLRDRLRDVLDEGGGGRLQLPSMAPVIVACDRYRLTEEQRLGGYCTFDMIFVEQGEAPGIPPQSSREALIARSQAMIDQVLANLAQGAAA